MFLATLHPGVSLQDARDNMAWELRVAKDLEETPPPTEEELRLVRGELGPEGATTR
jgi:glutaconate CoA-transferase subunit B